MALRHSTLAVAAVVLIVYAGGVRAAAGLWLAVTLLWLFSPMLAAAYAIVGRILRRG